MVWFQCEDCGENLKKPKLSNHFRGCSASKLSCIDCGVVFDRISVQQHTSCVTEAEKYGPKGVVNNVTTQKPKTTPVQSSGDLDLKLGLSTRPPWACSICNVKATSEEALSLHSEGKKHRNKVKASVAKVKVNGTGTVNLPAEEIKSAAIPGDEKNPTEQSAVVDTPVAVKKKKSNQNENGAAALTSVSRVVENASNAGVVGGLKQQKKRKKGVESAVASGPGAAEHEAVIGQGHGKKQKKSKKSKVESKSTEASEKGDTRDGKLVKENIDPQYVVSTVTEEVRQVEEGKRRKSQDHDVIQADGLTESDNPAHAETITQVKKPKKRKDDRSKDHLKGLTLDDQGKGETVKPKDDKVGKKKKSKC